MAKTTHPSRRNLDEAYAEAQRQIAEAARTKAEGLNVLYLGLTRLPPEIGQLTALTELYLNGNQLSSLPPEIGQLTALTELYLNDNQLSSLPPELQRLTRLERLFLHGNPQLALPPEVLGPTLEDVWRKHANPARPADILGFYFRRQAAETKRPILEAKLILVGWGAVGKTSLRRRLVDGTFDPKEQQTHKIEITPWPVMVGHDPVKLHVWDFGGQEIMHATHQFFLTRRSLYVLVLAGRQKVQGAQDAEYWLRTIQSFGGQSPVLVVLNKNKSCPFDLNRQSLMDKYPCIRGFIQTDCDPPLGLEELKDRILNEVDRLPDLRTPFDARWMAIKDAVSKLKEERRRRMAVPEYYDLCRTHGENDRKWQDWLLGFLHDLGTVVCFHDDPRLANDGVLDPQWVVDGIYTVLNEKSLQGGDGRVTFARMRQLLPGKDYTDDDLRVLLELMEKFQLCFPMHGRRDTIVVPELMSEQEAAWKEIFPQLDKCLRFELHFDFLPEGLLPRFIVATHDLSTQGQRWRSGVILRQKKNMALVRADAVDRRVLIAVDGPEPTRRDLLSAVRREFARIGSTIAGLASRGMVPIPGLKDLIPYDDLLTAEAAGETTWTVVVDGELRRIPIETLLDGIEPKEKRMSRRRDKDTGRPPTGINVERFDIPENNPNRAPDELVSWKAAIVWLIGLVVIIAGIVIALRVIPDWPGRTLAITAIILLACVFTYIITPKKARAQMKGFLAGILGKIPALSTSGTADQRQPARKTREPADKP